MCDADACYAAPGAQKLSRAVGEADGIMVAAPVYNYDVSAAAKNMIELTGKAWEDKIVGFLCAAGGMSSYMSVMAYANSLMLDFRCVIIPRFVYATGSAFEGDNPADDEDRGTDRTGGGGAGSIHKSAARVDPGSSWPNEFAKSSPRDDKSRGRANRRDLREYRHAFAANTKHFATSRSWRDHHSKL